MFRPTKLRHYVTFMQSRGFAPAQTLAGTGIDPAQLRSPGLLVDFAHYQAVVANMIRLTDNQGIGLDVGRESEITDFGVVGHAMMASNTARDAVGLWLRFSNALVGMLITMKLDEQEDGAWSLTLAEIRPTGFLYNFGVEELMAIAMKMGEALTRRPLRPNLIELSYPAPSHEALYAQHFGCTPRFNSHRTRIRFESPSLATPLKGADEEFQRVCLRHCSQLLRQIDDSNPIVSRIRTHLLSRMSGPPSLDEMARELAMSPRSLRRHLQDEGHSYTALVNQFRIDLARQYVGASRMTAKEAAYLLGYKDTNAFRRAFKTWTGHTVHAYRDSLDAEDGA